MYKKQITARGYFAAFCVFFLTIGADRAYSEACRFPRLQVGEVSDRLATWVPREGDILMKGLRSNALHYWSWAYQFQTAGKAVLLVHEQHLLEALVEHEGLIEGDAHQENYGWLRPQRGTDPIYGSNDRDDWGMGPFIFAFAKYYAVSASVITWVESDSDIKKKKLKDLLDDFDKKALRAYTNGVRLGLGYPPIEADEVKLPKFLKDNRDDAEKDLEKDYAEEIADRVDPKNEWTFAYGEKGLQNPDTLNEDSNEYWVYSRAVDFLRNELLKLGFEEPHSVAVRTKGEGGSAEQVRILFLVSKNGQKDIIEFKQQVGTSLDVFREQGDLESIMRAGKLVYWQQMDFPYRKEFAVDRCLFFTMRPLEPSYNQLEVSPEKSDELEAFLDLTEYQAQEMGRRHGEQIRAGVKIEGIQATEDYLKLLESNFSETNEMLREMTRLYLRVARWQHGGE